MTGEFEPKDSRNVTGTASTPDGRWTGQSAEPPLAAGQSPQQPEDQPRNQQGGGGMSDGGMDSDEVSDDELEDEDYEDEDEDEDESDSQSGTGGQAGSSGAALGQGSFGRNGS